MVVAEIRNKKEQKLKKTIIAITILLLVSLLVLVLPACAKTAAIPQPAPAPKPEKVIEARFTSWAGPGSIWGTADTLFTDLVNERFAGRLHLELFPASSLYTHRDSVDPLGTGAVEMTVWAGAVHESITGQTRVFYQPALWPNWESMVEFYQSPIGKEEVVAELERKANCYSLPFIGGSGFHHLFASKRINSLDDFKGLKAAVWTDAAGAVLTKLGATSGRTTVKDNYAALAAHQFNAQISGLSYGLAHGHAEFLPHLDLHGLAINVGFYVMNRDFWNSLPEDIRQVINDEISPKVQEHFNNWIMDEESPENLQKIATEHKTDNYWIPDAVWAEVSAAGEENLVGIKAEVGDRLYDAILKAIE